MSRISRARSHRRVHRLAASSAALLALAVLTAGTLLPAVAGPAVAAPADTEAPAVTATESLGGLRIGQGSSAVKRLLGPPEAKGKAELWGADGLYHQDWNYPAAGAVIGMSAPKAAGPWEVSSIALEPPAVLKSARGIGIGATRRELMAAYGRAAQRSDAGGVIVGNEFDGLVFSFDQGGRVAGIFLGATAE